MAEMFNPAPAKKEKTVERKISIPESTIHGYEAWAEELERSAEDLMTEALTWMIEQRRKPAPKKRGPKAKAQSSKA